MATKSNHYEDAIRSVSYCVQYLKGNAQISKLKEYGRNNFYVLLVDLDPPFRKLTEELLSDGNYVDEILTPIINNGVYKEEKLHFTNRLLWSVISVAKHSKTYAQKRELISFVHHIKAYNDTRPHFFNEEKGSKGVYRCYEDEFRSNLKQILK